MQDDDKKQDTPHSGRQQGPAPESDQESHLADALPDDLLDEEGDIDDADLADLDIDDVDLDDDFEDVSWDDFDTEESGEAKPAAVKKAAGAGFIKKNFTKLLIGGAAIGAIVIFFGAMSQPNKGPGTGLGPGIVDKTLPEQETTEARPESGFMNDPSQLAEGLKRAQRLKKAQQKQAEGLPPMPTPVQTEASATEESEEALTPMPTLGESPELELTESGNTVDDGALVGLAQEEVTEYQPFPSPVEVEPDNPTVNYAEKEDITIEPLEAQSPTAEESAAPEPAQTNLPTVAPDPENAEKLAELETFLTHSSADTNAQIAVLNSKIAELTATVEKLSKQADDAMARAKKAEEEAIAAKQAAKSAPAPATPKPAAKAEAPKPAPKTQASETQAKKPSSSTSSKAKSSSSSSSSAPQWQLRGASEGQAMVGQRGTNELVNVKVGDNIRGLGKITFIGQENGKWVVRGTTGKLSQ